MQGIHQLDAGGTGRIGIGWQGCRLIKAWAAMRRPAALG